jgi:hypothetical protein
VSSHERTAFLEQLLALGFEHVSDATFRGRIKWQDPDGSTQTTEVIITVKDDFPYRYPRVRPVEVPGPSWHLDTDHAMCLYSSGEETADLPWTDASTVIRRAAAWLESCAVGWKDQPVDMDLERYLPSVPGLFLYSTAEIDQAIGKGVRLRRSRR